MKVLLITALLAALCAGAGERSTVMPDVFRPGSTVLFIGDSITHGGRLNDMNHYLGHGYQAEIAMRYLAYRPDLKLQFENRGISGNTSSNLVTRWSTDAVPCRAGASGEKGAFGWKESERVFVPDYLSILTGVNDFHRGRVAVGDYERNLEFMVTNALAAKPGMKIAICQPFTFVDAERAGLAPYQQSAERVATRHALVFVRFQDLFSERLLRLEPNPRYWFWDTCHPTYAAHMLMADFWLESVTPCWRR